MKTFQMPILSMSLLGLCLLSGLGTPPAHADFTFEEPVSLQRIIPVLDPVHDAIFSCTLDGLEMYVQSDPGRPGGQGGYDLWVLKRDSIDADWGPPENLGPAVNGPSLDGFPSISADGLILYFYSNRSGGYGGEDLYMTTRATRNAPWGQAVNMGPKVNSPQQDTHPRVAPDNLELYFISARPGGYGGFDIYVCRRATASDLWGDPVNLGPVVNSAYHEAVPCLSPDGLLLTFSDFPGSLRPGGYGDINVWMARRATVSSPWQTPANLGPIVNSQRHDASQLFSPDGFTLYLFSTRSGGSDNYQVPIIPIVDFNADGLVDIADVAIMIEHWHTDYSLCDIGPMPWGDGIVDAQDLIVLAEHLFEDYRLVAHWKLDETDGSIAADSARNNEGTLSGEALWQPEGGQVGGALKLDGVIDCVITPFILNPADGQFSVFAWVKDGIPGQVIVSQIGGADWLCADPSEGRLTTGLVPPSGGVTPQPLLSESVITDSNWHSVGFVWDGSHRRLYVGGVVAAEDTQADLSGSVDGLFIGCGKSMEGGTFWSGLIDDVRIYNQALSAEEIAALAQ